MVEGTPPGDALPPPPQRATPARKGASCGAGAGYPRPHQPHPEHTGRGTLAARSRGRTAGGGTAPDTGRTSQRWQATPPGTPPHYPRGTQPPQGMQAKGTVLGPHTHTPAPTACGWRTPTARPVGGQSGEGQRLTPDAPHNGGRHPPSEQHRRARAQAVGPVLGPHARTNCTRNTRVAEPWLPAPKDGRPGEGQRLTPDAPHNSGRHPPRGHPSATPTASNASPQGRTLVGPVLNPHARTDLTRDTRVAEPRPPAREGGRLREGQRLTPDAPHNGGRPPPPGTAPHHPHCTQPPPGMQGTVLGPHTRTNRALSMWVAEPNSPSHERAVRGGGAPDDRRPSQRWKAPPPGTPFRHPHSEQRRPAGHTLWGWCGVLRPHRPHPGHTGRGTPAARPRGRAAGGGTAPDTRRPSQRWQATPPGDGPLPPPQHAAPTGHAGQGDSVGPPHPHTRAHSTWVADPNSPPSGRAVGGGGAPDLRSPSQRRKAPPPGTPFRHPHSEQRRPARVHAVGPLLGPHARTDRTRDTWVVEPRLPAPEDGRPGEGQRLTPDAPHNGGRPPLPGTAPHHPQGTQPPQGMQAKGTVLGPHTHTPAPTARGWQTPTARPVGGQSGEGERLTSDAPRNGGRHPPRGRPSATPTASNAGPQGRTLWGRCWVPTPAPTAPVTHGSRDPGRAPQRTAGRGRDSA